MTMDGQGQPKIYEMHYHTLKVLMHLFLLELHVVRIVRTPHGDERHVSAASPICSDFQTFCPDWLHFGHFLCFGGIAASQLSHRIFPIYF